MTRRPARLTGVVIAGLALANLAGCGTPQVPSPTQSSPAPTWVEDDAIFPVTLHVPAASSTFLMTGTNGASPDHATVTVVRSGNDYSTNLNYGTETSVTRFRAAADGVHVLQITDTLNGGGSLDCLITGSSLFLPSRLVNGTKTVLDFGCTEQHRQGNTALTLHVTVAVVGATHETFGGTTVAVVKLERDQSLAAPTGPAQVDRNLQSFDPARGLLLTRHDTGPDGVVEQLAATTLPPPA